MNLVFTTKIYLLQLHIKLRLIKKLVKAMNKEGEGFHFLGQMFPRVTDAKIREGNYREMHQTLTTY